MASRDACALLMQLRFGIEGMDQELEGLAELLPTPVAQAGFAFGLDEHLRCIELHHR